MWGGWHRVEKSHVPSQSKIFEADYHCLLQEWLSGHFSALHFSRGPWASSHWMPSTYAFQLNYLYGNIILGNLSHFLGNTACLVEMKQKLVLGTVSGPIHNSDFWPICKKDLGFTPSASWIGSRSGTWQMGFFASPPGFTFLVFQALWCNFLGRHHCECCAKMCTKKNHIVWASWQFGLKRNKTCTTSIVHGGIL